jgi:hypothetical protein
MQASQEEVTMVAQWVRSVGFAVFALTACGGNVKQEDSGTPTEQLQANGPSRCKAACEKIIACGLDKQECDCGCACPTGQPSCECGPCNCPANTEETPAKCESDCSEAVQKAVASSCAPAMLKLLDCLPSASCDSGQAPCKAESDAMKACQQKTSSDHSSSPPVGNPSREYPDGATSVSCAIGSGSGSAPVMGSTPALGSLYCTSGWDSCSDGKSYQVECRVAPAMGLDCSCQVDGVAGASYAASECTSDSSVVNQSCGWHLQ